MHRCRGGYYPPDCKCKIILMLTSANETNKSIVGTDVLDGPLQTQRLAINIVSLIRTVAGVPLMEGPAKRGDPSSEFTRFWGFPSRTSVPTIRSTVPHTKLRYSKFLAIVLKVGSSKRLPYNNAAAFSTSNQKLAYFLFLGGGSSSYIAKKRLSRSSLRSTSSTRSISDVPS